MDADEAYDEYEVNELTTVGRKWQSASLIVHVLAFVANFFGDLSRMFSGIAEDVCEHVNYKTERERFAAEAGRELEQLIEGPKEA